MISIITILIWITIAIIAIIAIIAVKLHYKGDQLEHEEGSILPSTGSLSEALSAGKDKINFSNSTSLNNTPRSLSPNTSQDNHNLFRRNNETNSANDDYIVPEVENNDLDNYEYKSQNQVLINYDNSVEKFQEPIKQSQMDIMTQNKKETSELKDLFTIDELIKESKRKDSEREKESQKISKDEEDPELREIKESIKNRTPEPLIEEVIAEDEKETITESVKEEGKSETPSVASQKDIDEAIDIASKESEKTEESESDDKDITDVLLNQEKQEEITEPTLKTPSKVEESKSEPSIDNVSSIGTEDDVMDLDYRKDLDKVKNKIRGSKIFQDVKDKLSPETEEIPGSQDEFIRNVNDYEEYDEYEPIINETYLDMEATYEEYHDQRLREENTRKILKKPQAPVAKPKVAEIKNKPARANIKININNNEVVLKKGDEIIFNHDGETYSSQVYAINGDDISVRYRRRDIKIKPSDVKKIY
jgi:hypothetical protein